MKLNTAHVVAYIVGGLTTLAAFNPQTAATLLGSKAGAIAAAIVGIAGLLLTMLHNLGVVGANPPAPTNAPKQGGFARVGALLCLLSAAFMVTLCISVLPSCSLLQSPTAAPYVTATVDIAVATAEQKGVPAAKINSLAKLALAADAGTSATLATVSNVVNAQIARLNLPAADQAAADILEVALSAAIQAKVGSNASVAQAQAAIADVLKAVISATGG